jgi:alpha-mannosidase
MNDMISHLLTLRNDARGYWAGRILSELEYAVSMSRASGRAHEALLRTTIESIASEHATEGALTRETVEETEARLQPLAEQAKSITLLCAAHAHVDMNWLWRFDETVAVTLDTFRTILTLMTEYPAFTFSQSQASAYRIVEEHDLEMLKEIRKRVKDGRWEVTASTWVEADKNLPNGESLARHALYTRRYLSALLDISPDSLQLDFEPDTFGHSRNVPEILRAAGVRWYYHCRGSDEHTLYRWQAPSGASVIAYRDPFWYNAEVSPAMAVEAPAYCRKQGTDLMLRVYGVGDHGGGPTRRDIERIIDMDAWPIFPRFRFGTFREFFEAAEKVAERLPLVNRELNPVFDGCYTSQSRIKAANRTAERRLAEAETFSSLASVVTSSASRSAQFSRAWESVMFNHFHDIVTGSGTVDTREYALGQFQRAMASAGAEESLALRRIAAHVDTSSLGDPREDARSNQSEGGGAGWGVSDFRLSHVERGKGRTRIVHVFNALPWSRTEIAEAVIWDWPGDPARLQVKDADGNELPHQIIPNEIHPFFGAAYWGHEYLRVLIVVTVPGCGYTTCSLSEGLPHELPAHKNSEPRVQHPQECALENERVRASFDPHTAALRSFVDKESGEEMLDLSRPAGVFRLVQEDESRGMTAWVVGQWMVLRCLHEGARISAIGGKDGLRQWLSYEIPFGASRLKATVSLDRGAVSLSWAVECEWLETGRKGQGVPQLNFFLPAAAEMKAYRFDVPFGTIDRAPGEIDQPANSWVLGVPRKSGRKALMLIADQSHGFRCTGNAVSLSLLRSSIDPDPHPELGMHRFGFSVSLADCATSAAPVSAGRERAHPLFVVSGTAHAGSLPLTQGFLSMEGPASFSALKMPEEKPTGCLLVRLYDTDGKKGQTALRFFCAPSRAWLVDVNENRLEAQGSLMLSGDTVRVDIEPHSIASVVVQFEGCH